MLLGNNPDIYVNWLQYGPVGLRATHEKGNFGSYSFEFYAVFIFLPNICGSLRVFYFKWLLLSQIWLFKLKKLKCSKYLIRIQFV